MKAMIKLDQNCDLCHKPINRFDTFYDGATKMGPWAWMCRECWQTYGRGVGLGIGQEYNSTDLEKIR